VPTGTSAWTKQWTKNYGGLTTRILPTGSNYIPVKFTPRRPFYCALLTTIRRALVIDRKRPRVVPWFKEAYQGPGKFLRARIDGSRSVKKSDGLCAMGRRRTFSNGPLAYVFGNAHPKPNLNKGAASMSRQPSATTSD